MERHTCKTYFSVNLAFDREKNVELLKERRNCTPEEIGIFNKAEVEKYIKENFAIVPEWNRHHFVIGLNAEYNADVGEMIRTTLKDLFGKEDKIRQMQKKFSVETVLEIAPCIASQSDNQPQNLSLGKDVIDFLYKSNTAMDLDYCVI